MRFECQKDCVICCTRPGVIYFSEEDIVVAGKFLRLAPDQFKLKYLVRAGDTWYIDVDDRPCPFLKLKGCSIHTAKPQQCRAYPFWRENLLSKKHWKVVGEVCPGVDVGPRISPDKVEEFLHKEI